MFLSRFLFRIESLLFPGYAAKKAQKERAEIQLLGQQLFSEQRINAIFPHLKIHRNAKSGEWIIRTNDKIEAYLLLNVLPNIGRSVTKYRSDRILTFVPINSRSSLTLIEYLCPVWTRLRQSGQDEVLFARTAVQIGNKTKNIMDFYMGAVLFPKK